MKSHENNTNNALTTRRGFLQLAAATTAAALTAALTPRWAAGAPTGSQAIAKPVPKPPAKSAAPEQPVEEVVSQIHNAPQWAAAIAYKSGDRVVELTQKPARAYQCLTAGTAAAPAPTGQGDSVKDGGGVVWKYLSDVDYITLTGWLYDAPAWKSGTAYLYHDYVTFGSPPCSYRCGKSGPAASTIAPADTDPKYRDHPDSSYEVPTKGVTVGADGYLWQKMATLGYTSGKSYIPTTKFQPNSTDLRIATVQMNKRYTAVLWNDSEYVAGERGENHPIHLQAHEGWIGEAGPRGIDARFRMTITAAPGESFMDHPDAPLHYDASKGVAIRNPSGGLGPWGFSPGNGLLFNDSYVTLDRLQIKSATGHAVGDLWGGSPNGLLLSNCILESDATGDVAVVELDCRGALENCLLIGSGKVGIRPKYPVLVKSCTIVSKNPTADSVGIVAGKPWPGGFGGPDLKGRTLIVDSAIFGWASAVAYIVNREIKDPTECWHKDCANNATDCADSSDHSAVKYAGASIVNDVLPGKGNHYKVPYDKTTFVDPASDWRIAPASPIKGIGMP